MARPNPGSVKPLQPVTVYLDQLAAVGQEAYDLARKMTTDRALRHWQPASFATATTYVARIYRTLLATWLLLDVLDASFTSGPPPADWSPFVSHHSYHPRRRTALQAQRVALEAKTRIVQALAQRADRTPQDEAQWERAFGRRQRAVQDVLAAVVPLRDVVTEVARDFAALTEISTSVYSLTLYAARALNGFAQSLDATALAITIDGSPGWAFKLWSARLRESVENEAAQRAEDAAIEAHARTRGYL